MHRLNIMKCGWKEVCCFACVRSAGGQSTSRASRHRLVKLMMELRAGKVGGRTGMMAGGRVSGRVGSHKSLYLFITDANAKQTHIKVTRV